MGCAFSVSAPKVFDGKNSDEGSRNSACIALGDIGPAAKDALPALRKALSDSRNDVRRFAQFAIEKIESK